MWGNGSPFLNVMLHQREREKERETYKFLKNRNEILLILAMISGPGLLVGPWNSHFIFVHPEEID